MSEYRDGLREVTKEVPYTVWTFFKWALVILPAVAVLFFIAQSLGIFSMNIEREIIQHSQQYTETKVSLLNKLHNDWLQLDAEIAELSVGEGNDAIVVAKMAQQKAIVKRIKSEAELIPSSQVPDSVREFLSVH